MNGPATFAAVFDIALEFAELWILLECVFGQFEQPRTDHAAVVPNLRNGMHVEVEVFAGLHNLEAFGIGLHHAVFDAVVDHLDEVTAADRACVQVAIFGGQIDECWFEALDDGRVAADHQTKAQFEAPDPARCPLVNIVDAFGCQYRRSAHVVVEVRVAAVDNGVAGAEQVRQIVDHRFGGRTAGQHDPDGPWCRQCVDQ